jgi:hypothetical protein
MSYFYARIYCQLLGGQAGGREVVDAGTLTSHWAGDNSVCKMPRITLSPLAVEWQELLTIPKEQVNQFEWCIFCRWSAEMREESDK